MAPEVSVGFQNSGKRFEKLTLNIRSSSALAWNHSRLTVLSGQSRPSRGSDFTGLANETRIITP